MYLDSCCEAVLRAVENGITSRTTDDPELLGTPVVKHPDIIRPLTSMCILICCIMAPPVG